MIATLLILFALLPGRQAYSPPPALAYGTASLFTVTSRITPLTLGLSSAAASLLVAPSDVISHYVFLPFVAKPPGGCAPIPGVQYGTLTINGPPTNRPAEQSPDFNLAIRGWQNTSAYRGLVDYGGGSDPGAPQLYTLFADRRVPAFRAVYQVYDWDWGCDCRGPLLTEPVVTLAGMATTAGEVLSLPDSGYGIGSGYEALVLYATEQRITLKYTRDDHVVYGYTIHVENVCVEPSLLALYRAWNNAGRGQLPALRGGQPLGRARGNEIGVAIRDTGSFMDPRSRKDWWQVK